MPRVTNKDTSTSLRIEQGPTDDLTLDPTNANRGTERGRETVVQSLQECGAGRSILADRNGTVIAGNKTLEAARKLGLPVRVVETAGDELLVVKRTDLALDEGDRARRLAYLDNRSSELGLEWDLEQLRADLAGGVDLSGCGFSDGELAALLQSLEPNGGLTDPDDVPEPPEEPVSKLGDIWLLGDHRLLCGDSTDAGAVAMLMNCERASLMFTDPPYLVDYQGGNHPQSWANKPEVKDKHWDDYHDPDQATAFFEGFLRAAIDEALIKNPAIYQCFGMMRCDLVMAAWRAAGLLPHQVVIWKKSRPVLGRVWFMYNYEPIMAGWHQGDLPDMKPPANERAVWEIAGTEGVEECVAGTHPTIKPVELVRRPIEWHTKPGELIYEPFSGSGTAIVAAERTGRRCYAMELSPVFVDVAVTRWQNFTGKEAERVET
jgi:DNA modification methylase